MTDPIDPNNDHPVQLKDPFIAGVLAWLIPGLGHFYQGRIVKGTIFMVCILGTFIYGLYLGGSDQVGWGRAVYFSFRPNDYRLQWLCQIGIGLPTVPMTLLQWTQDKPILNGFMAPPSLKSPEPDDNGGLRRPPSPDEMSLAWINKLLPRYFEMGTVYTMIAGLLNMLAIYDACCGPVPAESNQEEKPQELPEVGRDKTESESTEKKS